MTPEKLRDLAQFALEEMKAVDICALDVRATSNVTDYLFVASGTSDRHVRAIVQGVVEEARKHDLKPLGVEGETYAQWALVDLGDVVVHVMKPDVREFYQLEKLWGFDSGGAGGARAR